MRISISAWVVIALASPASAQTVDCASYGGRTRCTTEQPHQVPDFFGAYMAGKQARAQRQQQEADYAEQQSRMSDEASLRARARAAGEMVADGQCGGALNMALKAGDFGLAEHVKAMCK